MKKLSHYDASGSPRMVDVSAKPEKKRTARAHAFVRMAPEVLARLPENPKGNPLEIARIAGNRRGQENIRPDSAVPSVDAFACSSIEVKVETRGVRIFASAATTAQTGVEIGKHDGGGP